MDYLKREWDKPYLEVGKCYKVTWDVKFLEYSIEKSFYVAGVTKHFHNYSYSCVSENPDKQSIHDCGGYLWNYLSNNNYCTICSAETIEEIPKENLNLRLFRK